MPITINADDFGKSENVNSAICEAFEKGYIDTTTLMANMPEAHMAYELARNNGFADKVGVHLNITEGLPLTKNIRKNPLICDADGRFNAAFYHNTKYRLYMDKQTIDQITEELDAQISLFLDMGFTCLHMDSHHHVHTNYPIYCALKALAAKYDFDYIRLSRNLYRGGSAFNNVYKKIYNTGVKRLAKESTAYFGSYKDLMSYFSLDASRAAERLKEPDDRMKKFINNNAIEIMVHPMLSEDGILIDTDIPMNEERYALFVG